MDLYVITRLRKVLKGGIPRLGIKRGLLLVPQEQRHLSNLISDYSVTYSG